MNGPVGLRVPTVALLVLAVALLGAAPTAAAQESGGYAVEQGEQCIDVDPIGDGERTVEEFYDYRTDAYSSHGTTDYQADDASALVLYEGSEGTSLVVVHERYHENRTEGTRGSSATFNVTGISPGDGWAVEDDDYDGRDDEFTHHETYSEMNWVWSRSRTDGGAYRGLGGDVEIDIDPAFNEAAEKRYGGGYGGQVHEWAVVTATDDGFRKVPLDSMQEQATVRSGSCDGDGDGSGDGPAPPNASLNVSDHSPEVGETNVSLDAGGSEGDLEEYRWDVTGDGSVDRTTATAGLHHVFDDTGERTVAVTVVDGDGRTDSASASVDVEDTTPPTARIDASAEGTPGEPVAFSGEGSDDNHYVAAYEWTFGDGATAETDGPNVSHAYEAPGEYEAELRVIDPAGNANATALTVEVAGTYEVTVDANATTVEAGESIAFEADATNAVRYEWTFGDDVTAETDGPNVSHAYEAPGEYEAELRVENADGEAATDSIGIAVEQRSDSGGDDSEGDSGDSDDSKKEKKKGGGGGGGGGSSGGGSGGSGGGASPPSSTPPDDEAVEPTVDVENGAMVVTAEAVEAGEPIGVDRPANRTADGRAVSLASVEVETAEDVEAFAVEFEPVEGDVPGRFAASTAVVPNATAELESVTYEFAVDRERMAAAGVDAENLTAYARGTEWETIETETERDGDRVVVSATADGDAPAGVGTEEVALFVIGVETDGPVEKATVDLVATVRNTGVAGGERNLTVGVGDRRVTEVPVALDPGEETTVETAVTAGESGGLDVRAGATRRAVPVASVTDVSVVSTDVEPGEPVVVEATVRNRGAAAGEWDFELTVAGSVAATESVALDPGEETTVRFSRPIENAGTYEVAVADATETVRVGSREDDGEAALETTDEDGPGFGALAAVCAVLAVLARRLRAS